MSIPMQNLIFGLIGGLGLLLFGFSLMGQGFQKIAGEKIRRVLENSSNPILSMFAGLLLTIILQDGGAATVLLIGLLSSGLIQLKQAISMMLGINLGITIIVHLIAFRLGNFPLLAVGLGFFLYSLGKKRFTRYFGYTILGFGLVFVGLNTLTIAMRPLAEGLLFQGVFSGLPLWGYFFGFLSTALVQSSTATIGLLQVVAGQTAIYNNGAFYFQLKSFLPFLLGTGLGICTTATLASIKGNILSKRAVLAQWIFVTLTTLFFLLLLNPFANFVHVVTIKLWDIIGNLKELFFSLPAGQRPLEADLISRELAVAHSIYNLVMVIIWLPLTSALAEFLEERFHPHYYFQGEELENLEYLSEKTLGTPALALRMAAKEIIRTAEIATDMLYLARIAFIKGQDSAIKDIQKKEDIVDGLQKKITMYLSALLSRSVLTTSQSRYLAGLIHVINDVERIADHAENISEFAEAKLDEKLPFSQLAINELELLYEKVLDICKKAFSSLEEDDLVLAKQVLEREEAIDRIQEEMRQNHINRLNQGRCWPGSGIIYLEIIANLERVADHAANIAQVVLEGKEEMS
jgi:phosphate:Na+ symporter